MKKVLLSIALLGSITMLSGCQDKAGTAISNIETAADNFEVQRRIVFLNTHTDRVLQMIEGKCSTTPLPDRVKVVCMYSPSDLRVYYLGLSRNTTYTVEQMAPIPANVYHTRIIWSPQSIIKDIDFQFDANAAVDVVTPDNSDNSVN